MVLCPNALDLPPLILTNNVIHQLVPQINTIPALTPELYSCFEYLYNDLRGTDSLVPTPFAFDLREELFAVALLEWVVSSNDNPRIQCRQ